MNIIYEQKPSGFYWYIQVFQFFFRSKSSSTLSQIAIIIVWLHSLVMGSIIVTTFSWTEGQTSCTLHGILLPEVGVFMFTAQFILPTIIIIFFYSMMFHRIKHSAIRINRISVVQIAFDQRTRNIQKNIRIAKTLIIIVSLFLLCWSPFCTLMLVWNLSGSTIGSKSPGYVVTLMMGILNSCFNPIVYGWRIEEFRQAYYNVIKDIRSMCNLCKSPNQETVIQLS